MPSLFANLTAKQTHCTIGIGLVTAASIGLYYWYRNYYNKQRQPLRWRRVGELSELICYPIKSCGPVRLSEMGCTILGLEDGYLKDRIFMVTSANGDFVTARQHPKLVLIQPKIIGPIMKLSAPGMLNIEFNIENLLKSEPKQCSVWSQKISAIDAGEDVARWFSRFILSEDIGLRLVCYPKKIPTREVREKNKIFDTMHSKDTGAFHDATSFMLINESSFIDLNSRLEDQASILNFRPNFVVKGPLAYEEDHWKWVRIGNVVFRNVKPCTRCILTNVNPETGLRSIDNNPLATLKMYRQFSLTGESPVLGAHLGLRLGGKVAIGDAVYVDF